MGSEYIYSKFNRLPGRQLSTLMQLRISTIYHTFTIFVEWAVEGRYDFHMLPYALKTRLNPGDVERLKEIRTLYKKGLLLLRNSRVSNVEFINVITSGEIDISMSLHGTTKAIMWLLQLWIAFFSYLIFLHYKHSHCTAGHNIFSTIYRF